LCTMVLIRKYFMYKTSFLIAFSCFLCFLNIKAQNNKYDYISSGYYELVYEADIAHRVGNDSLAFIKLQEAEKRCPMIYQQMYQEMDLFCFLLLKNGQYDKSISYMDTLATKYGTLPLGVLYEMDTDSIIRKELLLKVPNFYDSVVPRLYAKYENFYTPERDSVIQILKKMSDEDQKVRQGTIDYNKMQKTDSINLVKIFEFIDKYGYPDEKLLGNRNLPLYIAIGAMIVHQSKSQKLQEMLIRFVREGKCSPRTYGFFIDHRMLGERKKFIFHIYSNATDDQIFDVDFVNQRRLAIGMPTREMERKRNELIKQKYEL